MSVIVGPGDPPTNTREIGEATPWSWRPDPGPWIRRLIPSAQAWTPDPALYLRVDHLRQAIIDASEARASWLRHPCMSRLTFSAHKDSTKADITLAAWVAANTRDELGSVAVPHDFVIWSPSGDEPVPAGTHELRELGALLSSPVPVELPLDVWCRTTAMCEPGTWPTLPAAEMNRREDELADDIHRYLRTIKAIEVLLPEVLEWMTTATQVVRPLVGEPQMAHSSHDPDVPGMVAVDLCHGSALTLELLVHETAHLHLRAAEAAGPLVDPAHDGLYQSPLRADLRPLGGILLAYHALAYICAAYTDGASAGLITEGTLNASQADIQGRLDDARETVTKARQHLTDIGMDFIERTAKVADYAAS